ncbi:MAG: Zn-dependent exopeptidase M28 [Crenarchaeota archaeon]|nr:Zn-dependent exopeptidase M28 [Thermoproteota archaeon]
MALREILSKLSSFTIFDYEYVEKTKLLAEKLRDELESMNLEYARFVYPVAAPSWSWYLEADGEEIRSLPAGLSSGSYEGPPKVVEIGLDAPPEGTLAYVSGSGTEIMTPSFSSGAALAVSEADAARLKESERVKWRLKVRTIETFGEAYLVGNLDKPKRAVVAHYDSLWAGAVDNSSGVVAALRLLTYVNLDELLFIFIGFSEINMIEKEYWLPSFKSVTKAYSEVLAGVEEVVVLDCLGTGHAGWIADEEYLEAYSPFGRERLAVYGTPVELMKSYYHGTNDTPDKVLGSALLKDIKAVEKRLAQG